MPQNKKTVAKKAAAKRTKRAVKRFADGTEPATTVTVTAGSTNGTSYDFRVAAVNSAGQGPWSDVITATPVSGGVTTYASDAFTGTANSTINGRVADTGQLWQNLNTAASSWKVATDGASVYCSAASNALNFTVIDDGHAGGTYTLTLKSLGPSGNQGFGGMSFRVQDATNGWLLFPNNTSHTYKVDHWVAGVGQTAIDTGITPAVGDLLAVVDHGTSFDVKINGTVVHTVTDSTFSTATAGGLGSSQSAAVSLAFDDYAHTSA